jgi:hypothetical protein
MWYFWRNKLRGYGLVCYVFLVIVPIFLCYASGAINCVATDGFLGVFVILPIFLCYASGAINCAATGWFGLYFGC